MDSIILKLSPDETEILINLINNVLINNDHFPDKLWDIDQSLQNARQQYIDSFSCTVQQF